MGSGGVLLNASSESAGHPVLETTSWSGVSLQLSSGLSCGKKQRFFSTTLCISLRGLDLKSMIVVSNNSSYHLSCTYIY